MIGMDNLLDLWQKVESINERRNRILKALDKDYLDMMRVKSAAIGDQVRTSASSARPWTMARIKAEFKKVGAKLEKVAAAMDPSLKGSVIDYSIKYFTVSQIYDAINSSYIEGNLKTDPDVKDSQGITENVVKQSIRREAIKKYTAWMVGGEKANEYMEGAEDLLNNVANAVDNYNEMASKVSNGEVKTIAQGVVSKLDSALLQLANCKTKVDGYKSDVQNFYNNDFKKMARDEMMVQAALGTINTVKDNIWKVPQISLANSAYQSYHRQIRTANQETTNVLLKSMITHMGTIDTAVGCYEKALVLTNKVINKCRTVGGDFNAIYDQAFRESAFDRFTCKIGAGVNLGIEKNDVRAALQRVARSLGFNGNCQGRRRDEGEEDDEAVEFDSENVSLSISEIVQVCGLRKQKKTNAQIAQMFGIDVQTVSQIPDAECRKIDKEKQLGSA